MKRTLQSISIIGLMLIATYGYTQITAEQTVMSEEKVVKVELQITGIEEQALAEQLDAYIISKEAIIASTTFFEEMRMVVMYKEDQISLSEVIQTVADQGYAVMVKKSENQSLVGGQYHQDGTLLPNLPNVGEE